MKKLVSLIMMLAICQFGSAQMTKADVESILSGANVSSKEKIYVIFNRVYSGGQWVEKFDSLVLTLNCMQEERGRDFDISFYS